jgi:hypothetical protein
LVRVDPLEDGDMIPTAASHRHQRTLNAIGFESRLTWAFVENARHVDYRKPLKPHNKPESSDTEEWRIPTSLIAGIALVILRSRTVDRKSNVIA